MADARVRLRVPGSPVRAEQESPGVQVRRRVVLATGVRAAETVEREVVEVDADDLLELEWRDGLVEVMRASDVADGTELGVELRAVRTGTADRGGVPLDALNLVHLSDEWLMELVRKAARELGKELAERALEQGARRLLEDADLFGALLRELEDATTLRNVAHGESLRRMTASGVGPRVTRKGNDWSRVLLLVHGTCSSIEGGFEGWIESPDWKALLERYESIGGAVLGYQHYTVGRSPADNALRLAERLSDGLRPGTQVDVVSHSRGGLVAEALLPPSDPESWLALLQNLRERRPRDLPVADLDRLEKAAGLTAAFRFERFARVACPMLGTSLMSDRMDRFASSIFTVARFLGADANPFFATAKLVVRVLLKLRRDPVAVPGLAPMNPASPFVGLMNHPVRRADVVVGEFGAHTLGRGVLRRLTVGGARLLFLADNDLVVDTDNMFGGARAKQRWVRRTESAEVDHFTYFTNEDSRAAVGRFLKGEVSGLELPLAEGAVTARGEERGVLVDVARIIEEPTHRGDRPRLLLIPGVMGSRLEVDYGDVRDDRWESVWFSYGALIDGHFQDLGYDEHEVRAAGVMEAGYGDFVREMSRSYDVHLFPYDWRESLWFSGRALADRIGALLESSSEPLHVVAHSMGGLVLRAALVHEPTLGKDVLARKARFVMAGTPNGGSFDLLHMLTEEDDSVLNRVAMLDLFHDRADTARVARSFPGVLEMLPWQERSCWRDAGAWPRGRPRDELLGEAEQTQRWLSEAKNEGYPARLIYLAGSAKHTLVGRAANGRYRRSRDGDGRVPYESGIPQPVEGARDVSVYYADVVHGRLLDHRSCFEAMHELLAIGRTSVLPQERGVATWRVAEGHVEGRAVEVSKRPSAEEALNAVLCRNAVHEAPTQTKLTVSVVADSMHWARYPVLLGHYEGDEIVGTEATLDELMGHELSRRRALGRYAGKQGHNTVVLRASGHPSGAVVAGLGGLGDLTETSLQASVTSAVIEMALARSGAEADGRSRGPRGVSALLIGNRGALDVSGSVRALVNGVLAANAALQARREPFQVERLELIDLYESNARQAFREVRRLVRGANELPVELPGRLYVGDAARSAPQSFEGLGGWSRRVQIEHVPADDALTFRVLTERSSANATVQSTDWESIQRIVERARNTSQSATLQYRGTPLGWLLYSLLIPSQVHSVLRDGAPLQLVLDARAAVVPWELLRDSADGEQAPLVTRVELTRQLILNTSRPVDDARGDRVVILADLEHGTDHALPFAAREAQSVEHRFGSRGYSVSSRLVKPAQLDTLDVIEELFREPIRVLHIAAHGALDEPEDGAPAGRRRPYIRLGEGQRLDTRVLNKLGFSPAVVFLNCCHLGRLDGPHFASSIARSFIEAGAHVVVAAGWAVRDDAARTFAEVFYDGLLEGMTLGTATREARARTYERHSDSNTYGAFQVYGDPGFSLDPRTDATAETRWQAAVTTGEVLARLEVLESELLTQLDTREIVRDVEHAYADWVALEGSEEKLKNGEILQRFGELYLKLLEPEAALELFRRAAEDPRARASQALSERVLDAHTRRLRLAGLHGGQVTEEMQQAALAARKALQADPRRPSLERHALLGSSFKEEARYTTGSEAKRALSQSFRHYLAAHRLNREDTYPMAVLEMLALVGRAGLRASPDTPAKVAERLAIIRSRALVESSEQPQFWNVVAHADTHLISHLDFTLRPTAYGASSTPHATLSCVREWYTYAYSTVRSPYYWQSSVEIARWLLAQLDRAKRDAQRDPLKSRLALTVDSMKQIVTHLEALEARTRHGNGERPPWLHERTDWVLERRACGISSDTLVDLVLSPDSRRPSPVEPAAYEPPRNPFAPRKGVR